MRLLSFDIEIAEVFDLRNGEDLDAHGPFHISVASTAILGGEERLWYSAARDGTPAPAMTATGAAGLLGYLDRMQRAGYMVCAWNGLGFDLRWIAHNAGDLELGARVALGSYDPMFQFFNQRGFPVGLAAVGRGMGVARSKLMSGADAPREWRDGNYQAVKDYVMQDSRITNDIVAAIVQRKEVRWVTARGTVSREPMSPLKTVRAVLADPEPDQSWMDRPMPRRRFHRWIPPDLKEAAPLSGPAARGTVAPTVSGRLKKKH